MNKNETATIRTARLLVDQTIADLSRSESVQRRKKLDARLEREQTIRDLLSSLIEEDA